MVQKDNAEVFAANPGRKRAVRILGDGSYITEDQNTGESLSQRYLENLGIQFGHDIEVNANGKSWGVVFNPEDKKVQVKVDNTGELLHEAELFKERSHAVTPRSQSDSRFR